MRRWLVVLLAGIALALWVGGRLSADDQQLPLRLWVLRLPGTELGLDVADMDGDGLRDIVVAHMAAPSGPARAVSTFRRGPKGSRFPSAPTRTRSVPADACAFLAGDFDPHPGGEVVLLCPDRVLLLRGAHESVEVCRVRGFFDYPEQGGLPVWDLAWDLDGDGLLELVVPTKDGYRVFARRGEGPLQETSSLQVTVQQRFGPGFETLLLNRFLTATARLRRLVRADLNGDGRADLVAYRDRGLARFHQREDGTFPLRPDRETPLQIVAGAERADEQSGSESEAFSNIRLGLDDVDGDGRADLLATRTLGEVGVFESLRTQQLIFRAREDGSWDEASPDLVLNLKGLAGDPQLLDWDGDGLRDVVLATYRMDLLSNVKRAITESMSITHMVFRQRRGEAFFPTEPDLVLDVDVPLESLQRRGGAQAVLLGADLNGDGVGDMVRRRPDGGLSIELGTLSAAGEAGFDSDRPIRLAAGRTEPPRVVDFDQDGRDELVLEPFAGDDAASRTVRVLGGDW